MDSKLPTFGTCLSCMDGRVILPSTQFIKDRHGVQFVDIISEAGMDGFLARSGPLDGILRKLDLSFQKHGSSVAYIVGHADCSGNVVDDEKHKSDIHAAIDRMKTFRSFTSIGGIFIGRDWKPIAIGPVPVAATKPMPAVSEPPVFTAPPRPVVEPSKVIKPIPVAVPVKPATVPGRTLVMVCRHCKAENLPDSTFCDQCGKPLHYG